jgi:hypothetical protein
VPPVVNLLMEIDQDSVETGVWCDRCLLPSGVGYRMWAWFAGQAKPEATNMAVRTCTDCGGAIP